LNFLTDFADQAVAVPLAAVIALLLALAGWTRAAFAWVLMVAATLGTIAFLKIIFIACGPSNFVGVVHSPSGHTATAAIIYGGLLALISRRCGVGLPWALSPAPIVSLLIGLSRISLGAHTWPEVLIGGLVGCAGTLTMLLLSGVPPPRVSLPRLVAFPIAIALIMHGNHIHVEDRIKSIGVRYAWIAAVCGGHASR